MAGVSKKMSTFADKNRRPAFMRSRKPKLCLVWSHKEILTPQRIEPKVTISVVFNAGELSNDHPKFMTHSHEIGFIGKITVKKWDFSRSVGVQLEIEGRRLLCFSLLTGSPLTLASRRPISKCTNSKATAN